MRHSHCGNIMIFISLIKFKGPAKSFGHRGLKLLSGIRVIAEGLAQRPRPEAPTRLELHLFKLNSPVYYPLATK